MSSIRRWTTSLAMAALALCLAGCPDLPIETIKNPPGAIISARPVWAATGDLRNPAAAVDGNVSTAAISETSYGGSALTIDLGKPCVFNMVILDHGSREFGFARKTVLLTSLDGKNFQPHRPSPGTRRVTTLLLMAPVLARYIRVQAVVPGDEPWAIAEIVVQ